MYKKVDLIRASIATMRLAKTDNEKLAICAEIMEMQSELIVDLDDVAGAFQGLLKIVASNHMKESKLRDNYMNLDYTKFIR